MHNPFKEITQEHETDLWLVQRILNGCRQDLEKLIVRHQAWIYNIALKMVLAPSDAEDITQEILIKLVTRLSTFDPEKGAFRTWLYRIVANHVISMKKRKCESLFTSFEESADAVEKIPDQSVDGLPESKVLAEELKIKCWTGMLLCLNRKQRVAFILGGIFEVSDTLGGEILEVSKANYRKLLSRARLKIDNFMQQKCGLLKSDNPCNCNRKLKGFIENGFVNPDHIRFFQDNKMKIKEVLHKNLRHFERLCTSETIRRFQEHPFYDPPEFGQWMAQIFNTEMLDRLMAGKLHS
ncbi:MAG: RNA polymerase sigma factor [Deltaproteobacteria bacterium]|nr:RNA polymerase sigma factor [Deltaproteobacteria bacterium]